MPDNLQHVQPGAPFEPSAATWNEFIDAARAVKDHRSQRGENALNALIQPHNTCLVKYDASTGSTLAAFSTLSYGTPLIDPSAAASDRLLASKRPAIAGVTPSAATANRPFLITMEPIQGGSLGRAVASGLAVVQVSVSSASHWRAKPSAGVTANLVSAASGGVPILWKESGTGTKWAMVLLDFGDDSRSADCSDMLGLVRADKCLRMTITEVQGSCSDIDTTQTADLTYDAAEEALISADLLYGCPPGVTTTICSTGAPNKFNIVVAGFGAPNTNLNQSYTVTHTTGEIWTATKGGVTVTATRISGGWTLSLDDGTVTVTYDTTGMDVCCSTVTFDLLADDGTTTAPATLSMTIATACGDGPSYTPRLERVSGDCGLCLKFTWVPTAGSGSRVIPWKQVGCGEDADGQPYIEFATDDPVICTGTDGAACTGNKVVARLTCSTCPCECGGNEVEFSTAGWYKVSGNLQGACCEYFSSAPVGRTMCTGPFSTQGSCEDICDDNGWDGPGYYCTEGGCQFFANDPGNGVYLCAGPYATVDDCTTTGCDNGNTLIACGGTPSPKWVKIKVWIATDNECAGLGDWFPSVVEALVEVPASGSTTVTLNGPAVLQQPPANYWDWDYTKLWSEGQDINLKGPPVWAASLLIGCDGSGGYSAGVDPGDGPAVSAPGQVNLATYVHGGADMVLDVVDGPNYGPFSVEYKATVPVDSTPGSCNYGVVGPPFNKAKFHVRIEAASAGCATDRNIPSEGGGTTEYFVCRDGLCVQCTDPTPGSFNCIPGVGCVEVFDGSGEYATQTACLASCGSTGGGGGGPTSNCGKGSGSGSDSMAITGGTKAGTYAGTWHAGAPDYESFDVGFVVVLEFFSGAWHLVWTEGGTIHDITADSGTCSPFNLVFSGGPGGATTTEINP